MTPQLYINYKLKSVRALPWRGMLYRFLNTIIDDLFAFVIDVPVAYRVACFRDDIVFVAYLWQRWTYADRRSGLTSEGAIDAIDNAVEQPSSPSAGDDGRSAKALDDCD